MDDIKNFISQFTDESILDKESNYIIAKQGRSYFLTDKKTQEFVKKTKQNFFSIGILLGETKKSFRATPALIDLIAKKTDKKVNINKKSEWLFLCGRDVFDDAIIRKKVNEGIVIVQNERNETLGYGKFIRQGKRKLIKNILDKGFYLRREN